MHDLKFACAVKLLKELFRINRMNKLMDNRMQLGVNQLSCTHKRFLNSILRKIGVRFRVSQRLPNNPILDEEFNLIEEYSLGENIFYDAEFRERQDFAQTI